MLKEAMQYLVNKGVEESPIVITEHGTFSTIPLHRVKYPEIETLGVSTLTSLVDFLNNDVDGTREKYLIHVVSPTQVDLLTPIFNGERECIMSARAILPRITYEQYLETEKFNIMLQSTFADNDDKSLLLRFTGLIKEETVKETGDNGISQKATIKTGIATVGEAEVPNPVTLAPYRTFMEIDQVESKFIFRLKDGPMAALFEADGGAWKNKVMDRIKGYLVASINEGVNYNIIS